MTGTMNLIQDLVCRVTDPLLRQGFSNQMTEGTLLFLDDVRLFRPTADAGTLLQLENIFESSATSDLPAELRQILEKIIARENILDPDFDFGKIESLTSSKSFGSHFNPRINGSWFRNLEAWGKGMYPGDNLRSDTPEDWEDNVWHIEKEGFSRRSPVRVAHYGWYDRFVASNSGGSHHAAKVIWQGRRDNIPYLREVLIENLSIDAGTVRELESRFFSFMYLPRKSDGLRDADAQFRLLLRNRVSDNVWYLSAVRYHENLKFAFITKEALRGRQALFSKWMTTATGAGKIIPLPLYLKNPQDYHKKPYLHDVSNIFLGTPF
ncbi:hypothetical protein SAMN03159428_04940 [Kosakonia radicincitans]|uniref:Uncharacterized protein n=1 Tax=Kosakonia radicincitans TaxID=283686 RepID=A0AAX2EZ77_9ENTR|nr:hypothetical protein [Kosakonia radicincitans]SFF38414.1 hypothetical protein SAMN03159468_04967 [Kosakonia radicincitans]SFR26310.1 hypothetical protein SAMN03159514_04927 [Kosakonia radicincitans]SFU16820.1 hypothetical protein SAMN03159428_04940 [Kosakonia radicincitans]SFY32284.1 hypothetical protein SAMN03159436_04917 [Kosakonia radicincitans]